jgi:type II secretory pathway component GspD/PulD (secretin)
MNRFVFVLVAIAFCFTGPKTSVSAAGEEEARPAVAAPPAAVATSAAPEDAGVPIHTVIRAVAKKTGKKVIIDSRVHGNVQLLGEEVSNVTYSDLLMILQVQGYTAVEGGGFLRVIPEAIILQSPVPLVVGNATYPDAQYVSALIPVRKVPAGSLVPILRPLLPQQAHLAAAMCSNTLLMVDTFANVRRIESLVAALDTGDPYKVDRCDNAPRASASGPKSD